MRLTARAVGRQIHSCYRMYNQLVQKLLTWSGHVLSWVDEPGLNVLVVRYEDMHRDPEAAFGAMVRFAGLEFDLVATVTTGTSALGSWRTAKR